MRNVTMGDDESKRERSPRGSSPAPRRRRQGVPLDVFAVAPAAQHDIDLN
jgi:hypothetical protein